MRPSPEGDREWRISENGGSQPHWSRDGGELFYVEGATLIAVNVTTTADFSIGLKTLLFGSAKNMRSSVTGHAMYDVSVDGSRFVIPERVGAETFTVRVVQNWYEEFRDREQD